MADDRAFHSRHDLELVAAWAAGEATGADLGRAERLLDSCDLCVGLARDLRAITLAVQDLPSVAAMADLPAAPRDFRLTPEQAARLRPSAPVARWTDRLFGAVAAFGRPVGASLATLGLVGLLVGAGTLGSVGGGTTSQTTGSTNAPIAADLQASAAPNADGGAAGAQPAASKGTSGGTAYSAPSIRSSDGAPEAAPQSAASSGAPRALTDSSRETSEPQPATWLLLVSAAAIVGGIGLILLATRRG